LGSVIDSVFILITDLIELPKPISLCFLTLIHLWCQLLANNGLVMALPNKKCDKPN